MRGVPRERRRDLAARRRASMRDLEQRAPSASTMRVSSLGV